MFYNVYVCIVYIYICVIVYIYICICIHITKQTKVVEQSLTKFLWRLTKSCVERSSIAPAGLTAFTGWLMFSFNEVKALLSLEDHSKPQNLTWKSVKRVWQTVLVGNVLQNVRWTSQESKFNKQHQMALTKSFRRISQGQKVLKTPETAETTGRK